MCRGIHSALCGVTITGSMLIVDVGVLKEGRKMNRIGSNVFTPRIGYQYENPAKIQVCLENDQTAFGIKSRQPHIHTNLVAQKAGRLV